MRHGAADSGGGANLRRADFHRWLRSLLPALLLWLFAGCSAVTIETGRTEEEQSAASASQASELRRNWARTFDQADEIRKADLLKTHIDSTTARLISVGRQFGNEWQNGNKGRGQVIPAEDFRRVIDNSVAKDRPILQAWEDNLEYGWEWVRDSSHFDQQVLGLFSDMVGQWYDVYNTVFYPEVDVETYLSEIDRIETATRNLSYDLERELNRLR